MNISIKKIRAILITTFILITIGGTLASVYVIGLTTFGVGWAGGEKSFLGIIWGWKGLWILTIYSIITCYGLIKNYKNGIIFGLAVSVCFLIYFIYDFVFSLWFVYSTKVIRIFEAILYFGLTTLVIIGLNKIRKSHFEFRRKEYLTVGFLALIVILSFYFMFD